MLWPTFTLAIFSFLRSGEFTCNGKLVPILTYPEQTSVLNLIFCLKFLEITIKKSKTDPFHGTANLTIAKSNSNICAVTTQVQDYCIFFRHMDRVPSSFSSNSPMGAILPVYRLPTTCVSYCTSEV